MIDVYTLVFDEISTATNNVYPDKAGSDAQFPYAVFKFPSTLDVVVRDEIILEIDVWDSVRDGYDVIKGIEGFTNIIDNSLRNKTKLNSNAFYKFERIGRSNIEDPDPNIFRRQLRYRIKKY